ncbi:QWRF motif-containing protein 2-like [Impatiens glandulifera]|uniref:QWRF motif-containing protein 2-like n=1 Tax=Impatiens glandulifera TaxID=253017 RepID=UPI001FB09F70|nr:QWRF motif-containing protein 2-like [Impatiens glandulifera]
MMVAAVSVSVSGPVERQNSRINSGEAHRRPPLLPSERDNGVSGPKKTKSRQVSSRYMSPSPSTSTSTSSSFSTSSTPRRCPSPLVSRNSASSALSTPASGVKRSVSADRRRSLSSRPLTPDLESRLKNVSEVSAATRLLVTSTRSLSVSFQGEAFSLPISKTKVTPSSPNLSSVRKGTPERRRSITPLKGKVDGGVDQVDNSNSKSVDQHRWPARTRQPNFLGRSLDCSDDRHKLFGSVSLMRTLQQSMIDDTRRSLDSGNGDMRKASNLSPEGNSINEFAVPSDLTASDSDSVSSGSNSGVHDFGGIARGRIGRTGKDGSARFWQETNSRLRRLHDPGSQSLMSPVAKFMPSSKFGQPKKFQTDSPVSSPRTISSPLRGGGIRPASPSRTVSSSPLRRTASPSRVRNSVGGIINSSFNETPSVLSFAVDVRRGKVGENRIVDAHMLRLFYNRYLQWRFVNANTESALLTQKRSVEKNLWNAWRTISDIRDSVTKKRHRLKLLKQKLKLASILKEQMKSLEDWACLDKDHSISLFGAIKALEASTLRLPVVGGALADVQSINDAINSAVDVMQAMGSSICSLLLKVEELNSLVAELTRVIGKEKAQLEQCKEFLWSLSAMQVKDCSLRTHTLQHNREPTA